MDVEYDEILEQEAREQLLDLGYNEDTVEDALENMRDSGMFDVEVDW